MRFGPARLGPRCGLAQLSYGSPRQYLYGRAGLNPDADSRGSYVSIMNSLQPDTVQPANKSKEKEERDTMNKEQQCRTSKKDVKLIFNKRCFRRCTEIPCGYCACVSSPSHGGDYSVDQSTDGVCSSNLLAPFQTSHYPKGGVLREEYGSIRLTPTFGGGTRAVPYRAF